MKINEFKLERYFALYEFTAKYLLSPSDCESLTMGELLAKADPESLELWRDLKLGYTESRGHPILREEIAKLYKHANADQVITVVPEEGIFLTMHALLEADDHVIIIEPAYQSLVEIPRSLGCSVTRWPVEEKDGQWHLDPESLRKQVETKTKMIIVNFPHNPTGYLPRPEDFNSIIEIARQHNLYLFSDEMYWLLEHQEGTRLTAAADIYEKGISLFGLSKTFSLPGLRIGWLVSQEEELLEKIVVLKDYTTICGSAPAEILAIMALRQREGILKTNKERIEANLAAARAFFTKRSQLFTWLEPQGGSTAFVRLNPKYPVEELCHRIVSDMSIMIIPGTIFDYEGNYFRIGLGRDNFPKILSELEEYFDRLKKLI